MTFNKKAINVEEHVNSIQLDNYVPSKWERQNRISMVEWNQKIVEVENKSRIKR